MPKYLYALAQEQIESTSDFLEIRILHKEIKMSVYSSTMSPLERSAYENDVRKRIEAGHKGDDIPIIMEDFGCDYEVACEAVFSGNKEVALALLAEAVARFSVIKTDQPKPKH